MCAAGRFRVLALCSCIVLVLLCSGLETSAQNGSTHENTSWASDLFGSRGRTNLPIVGQETPSNVFIAALGDDVAYDDNIPDATGARSGDVLTNAGAHLSLLHQGTKLSANLDYVPYFQLYKTYKEYDRVNQQFAGDATLFLSRRWLLRAAEAFIDQRATYVSPLGDDAIGTLGAPTGLNTGIYTLFTPDEYTSSRVDVAFAKDSRTVVTAFGGYEQRTFGDSGAQTQGLTNTSGALMGAALSRRVTEHVELGTMSSYQQISSTGSATVDSLANLRIESVFASSSWRLGPLITVDGFFGPQFLGSGGGASGQSLATNTVWAEGATLIRQAHKTTIYVTGQRLVSDGGGLLDYVTTSTVDIGLRRNLTGLWNMDAEIAAGRNDSLVRSPLGDNITNQTASCNLQRASGNLTYHISYLFLRQQGTGAAAIGKFHRNEVAFGVFYQLKRISLGH